MLLENFYSVKEKQIGENTLGIKLSFDENHKIYEGHFPSNPITPGVCLMQVAKQLIEFHFDTSLRIDTIINVKFLRLVVPDKKKILTYNFKFFQQNSKKDEEIVLITLCDEQYTYVRAKVIYTIK